MSSAIVTADRFWIIKNSKDLCYMSLLDNGHSNRKETGLQWGKQYKFAWDIHAQKHIEGPAPVELEFDNEAVSGIEIMESHERYSTNNQVMQVRDPRGFEVQIYINNLTFCIFISFNIIIYRMVN